MHRSMSLSLSGNKLACTFLLPIPCPLLPTLQRTIPRGGYADASRCSERDPTILSEFVVLFLSFTLYGMASSVHANGYPSTKLQQARKTPGKLVYVSTILNSTTHGLLPFLDRNL